MWGEPFAFARASVNAKLQGPAGPGSMPLDILILRDPRESTKKCSLTPLRGRAGVRFVGYHQDRRIDAGGRLLLSPDAPALSAQDCGRGIFLIDCSWRRVASLRATVDGEPIVRSLPDYTSAYPRKSRTFEDPSTGLASIEALYVASVLLGEPELDLLSDYRWRDDFLKLNPSLG